VQASGILSSANCGTLELGNFFGFPYPAGVPPDNSSRSPVILHRMNPQKPKKQERTKARVTEMPRRDVKPEAMLDDPDPGMTQKQNQNGERDDPLAA